MRDDLKNDSTIVESGKLSIEKQRKKELRRLEALLKYWYPIAVVKPLKKHRELMEDDKFKDEIFEMATKAVPLVLRIMERKSGLLGLDHAEANTSGEMKEKSIEELAEIIRAKNPNLFLYEQGESGRT